MNSSDLDVVAELHADSLPDDPATLLGRGFLASTLYPGLLASARCALVSEESGDSGRIDGFVVFGTGSALSAALRRSPVTFVHSMGSALVRHPSVLGRAADVAILLAQSPAGLPAVELQWIAVREGARRTGVGGRLVSAGLAELSSAGEGGVWVKTLQSTPGNVRFYETHGFSRLCDSRGRVYLVAQR